MERFPEGGQMLIQGASNGSVYPVGGFFALGKGARPSVPVSCTRGFFWKGRPTVGRPFGITKTLRRKVMKRKPFFVSLACFVFALFIWGTMIPTLTADEQKPLYIGVHHFGLYTGDKTDALSLAKWYEKNFGFKLQETPISYFAIRPGSGSLEIMKKDPQMRGHIGIEVSDLEAARKDLESKGLSLTPTVDAGFALVAYIKSTDPAGYLVHIFYVKK